MVRRGLFTSLLAAASAVQAKHVSNVIAGAYIVEFEAGKDTSAYSAKVEAEATTRLELSYKLFNGASIQFNDIGTAEEKAAELLALPEIKNMFQVKTYSIPKPDIIWTGEANKDYADLKRRQEGADTFSTHVMTQVDKLRAEGYTGKGIKIAVIDTGIDYGHPALGGCFGAGCLVSFGTDLVGDAYDGYNEHFPDPDPIDCAGHGTHVAGTIAAQSNIFGFTGAAPGVTLGAFKVFGCEGEVANDVLIASYNLAYEAGSDIITASIGGPSGWSEEPWAVAVERIVAAGVPCLVAAGNSGSEGMFFASTAANGKSVTAVASFDNTYTPAVLISSTYTVDGGEPIQFGYTPGEPAEWAGVTLPLWSVNFNTADPANGCDPYPAGTPDLSGYIVLVRRGTCTFVQKVTNAANAGAKYVMLYNNVAGASSVSAPGLVLAIGMTTPAVGAAWIAELQAGKTVVLSMTDPTTAEQVLTIEKNNKTGGFLSTYTSWGPTWEADTKPQYGAPGGMILSTWPRALGSYAVISGTSMATPLIAAITALVAEVRKTFDPVLIENLLSATANPQLFNNGQVSFAGLAPVPQQGAGLVQAYDAAYATTILSVSDLNFNDSDHRVAKSSFSIKNVGASEVTFALSNVGAYSAYLLEPGTIYAMAFPNELTEDYATLAFSSSSVTVPAGGEVTVEVTPTPPSALDASRVGVWSGYIALNGTDGSSLSLPYQGVTGSLHSLTVFDGTLVTTSDDDTYTPVPDNTTFILPIQGTANQTEVILPALAIGLAMGSAFVRADLVPLTTCPPNTTTTVWGTKTIGQPRSFPQRWLSRGVTTVDFDGQLDDGSYAPAGKYKFVVKALHIFGDETNLEEFDVGETQAFRITYATPSP